MAKGKSAVVDDLDDELELVADEDDAPAKPKKGKGKTAAPKAEPKAESTGMGAAWLAEYVNEECDTELTAANIRVILRKMAKEGEFDREVGEDRARYQFTGERDPIVKAVIKRVKNGEVAQAKAERLAAAKSGSSKKAKAVEPDEDEAPAKKAKSTKKAKVEEIEDETPAKPVRRKRKTEE